MPAFIFKKRNRTEPLVKKAKLQLYPDYPGAFKQDWKT